jgi:hypothetical protein
MLRNLGIELERLLRGGRFWCQLRSVLGLVAMLAAGGCADRVMDPIVPDLESTDDFAFEEYSGPQTLLTSITLADGNRIDFTEVEGGIVISAKCAESEESLVRAAFDIVGSADPIAIYKQLADTPAPAELVAAQERVSVVSGAKELSPFEPPSSDLELEPGRTVLLEDEPENTVYWNPAAANPSVFSSLYCSGGGYFNTILQPVACWTSLGNSLWTDYRYTSFGRSVAHCVNGTVRHVVLKWILAWDPNSGTYVHKWVGALPSESIDWGETSVLFFWSAPGFFRSCVYQVDMQEVYHLSYRVL